MITELLSCFAISLFILVSWNLFKKYSGYRIRKRILSDCHIPEDNPFSDNSRTNEVSRVAEYLIRESLSKVDLYMVKLNEQQTMQTLFFTNCVISKLSERFDLNGEAPIWDTANRLLRHQSKDNSSQLIMTVLGNQKLWDRTLYGQYVNDWFEHAIDCLCYDGLPPAIECIAEAMSSIQNNDDRSICTFN